MAFILVFVAFVLAYIAREVCPRGPIFTSIELDDIRLDRLDDIESSLKNNINNLKVCGLGHFTFVTAICAWVHPNHPNAFHFFIMLFVTEQAGLPPQEEDTGADGPGHQAQAGGPGGEVQRQGKIHLRGRLGRRGCAH